MLRNEDLDDNSLGAFVDGQFDAATRARIFSAMRHDAQLRERVEELRRLKDLMKMGFDGAAPPPRPQPAETRGAGIYVSAIAASLALVALGFTAGHFYPRASGLDRTMLSERAPVHHHKVIVHVGESDAQHFDAALTFVERFLRQHGEQGGQIEVVANAGGLDLLRAGQSDQQARLVRMINQHGNVQFIACSNAVRNLRLRGIEPRLLNDVSSERSALEHIVDRLQSGWHYIEADSLPSI